MAAALLAAALARTLDIPAAKAVRRRQLRRTCADLVGLYEDLHAHPELAFQETAAARTLAARLRALGFDVTEGVGRTGIVGLYRNGPGPTVKVRTELDAMPMAERTGIPHASRVHVDWNGKPPSPTPAGTTSTWRPESGPPRRETSGGARGKASAPPGTC